MVWAFLAAGFTSFPCLVVIGGTPSSVATSTTVLAQLIPQRHHHDLLGNRAKLCGHGHKRCLGADCFFQACLRSIVLRWDGDWDGAYRLHRLRSDLLPERVLWDQHH